MINKIDHIGIAVKDADKSLEIYRDIFGLEIKDVEVSEEDGLKTVSLNAGSSRIELYQPISHKSSIAAFIAQRGEGLHHLCFEVDDLKKTIDQIKENGLELIPLKPTRDGVPRNYAFVNPYGTNRVIIELKEKE